MKKLKPILFSTLMVQAILEGRKTMTRRIIKPQPVELLHSVGFGNWNYPYKEAKYAPRDTLWVRETFTVLEPENCMGGMDSRFVFKANMCADSEEIRQDYIKCGYPYQWKPSIFMPFAAARIFLEVTNVRCERLQDISEADAIAEGVQPSHCETNKDCVSVLCKEKCCCIGEYYRYPIDIEGEPANSAVESFQSLWESINGSGSWEANPWVFVYEFSQTIKPINIESN